VGIAHQKAVDGPMLFRRVGWALPTTTPNAKAWQFSGKKNKSHISIGAAINSTCFYINICINIHG